MQFAKYPFSLINTNLSNFLIFGIYDSTQTDQLHVSKNV